MALLGRVGHGQARPVRVWFGTGCESDRRGAAVRDVEWYGMESNGGLRNANAFQGVNSVRLGWVWSSMAMLCPLWFGTVGLDVACSGVVRAERPVWCGSLSQVGDGHGMLLVWRVEARNCGVSPAALRQCPVSFAPVWWVRVGYGPKGR